MSQLITGLYRDVLVDAQRQIRWDGGWRSNLIVHQCDVLLAALMKRQKQMYGILYWAVGEGEQHWDALCPSPHATHTLLKKEIARLKIKPRQIVYLDGLGNESESPTNCLEITAGFKGKDLATAGFQSLREFGLFGGDATAAADSGFMIDYVIHPRIDLSPEDTLHRTLHLTFAAAGASGRQALARISTALPLASIDGVGETYASALSDAGIHTLDGLAEIDARRTIEKIPSGKLRELQAKARLVTRLRIDPGLIPPFFDYSIGQFLDKAPSDLVEPGVPLEEVKRLQDTLADLQIALDDAQLKSIMLRDLINHEM
jgi:hypothetical protein